MTRDHGLQPVLWVGATRARARGKAAPVRIPAGLLGNACDLYLSRQHRVVVHSRIVERMFGVTEVLVAAVRLLGLPGVALDQSGARLTYVSILLARHEVIVAEGAAVETLLVGPGAREPLSVAHRQEIAVLGKVRGGDPVRLVPEKQEQRRLVVRHLKNDRALVPDGNPPGAMVDRRSVGVRVA